MIQFAQEISADALRADPRDLVVWEELAGTTEWDDYVLKTNRKRLDAMAPGRGNALAEMLNYRYQEILEEQYAPNNALSLFAIDRQVDPTKREHTVTRMSHTGDADFYRGSYSPAPTVNVEQEEQRFPIKPIVNSIRMDFFTNRSMASVGINLRAELEKAARLTQEDFLNDVIWDGAPADGFQSVIDYSFCPKAAASVSYIDATASEDILMSLHAIANFAAAQSKGRFAPNRMLMSISLRDYLANRLLDPANGSNATILSVFLERNEYISEVVGIYELDGAGPSGEDVIFCDRARDPRSVSIVIPQGFTMLPVDTRSFNMTIPCFSMYGGVIQRDPLYNRVAYVTVA